jgi:DNA-binding response OmpR family regulator
LSTLIAECDYKGIEKTELACYPYAMPETATAAQLSANHFMGKKPVVFVVDDDSQWSELLMVGLDRWGYDPQRAEDVTTAKEWLATNSPDLFLLDIMMPDGNGLDLCRWIRGQEKFKQIPIIIQSGVKDDELPQLAVELGAMDFLHKPVRLTVLQERIKKFLAPKSS